MLKRFPFTHQHDAMDCGPACLHMIAKHYGKNHSLQGLRENSFLTREGVSLLGISEAAEKIGFRTMGVKISFEQLVKEAPLPCIVHWKQNHFVVVYDIKLQRDKTDKKDKEDKMAEGLSNLSSKGFICFIEKRLRIEKE